MDAITPLDTQLTLTLPLQPDAARSRQDTAASAVASSAPHTRRRLSSRDLLGAEREIEIEHAGQIYRLRMTSLGKLILTK